MFDVETDNDKEVVYIMYEYGLMYHPSGRVTVHQIWSDGTETDDIRICPKVIQEIKLSI